MHGASHSVRHSRLLVPQFLVKTDGVGHQLEVGPTLRHLAVLQDQNLICVYHCGESMCNDDGGPPFGHSPESLQDVLQDMAGKLNGQVSRVKYFFIPLNGKWWCRT